MSEPTLIERLKQAEIGALNEHRSYHAEVFHNAIKTITDQAAEIEKLSEMLTGLINMIDQTPTDVMIRCEVKGIKKALSIGTPTGEQG